MLIIGPKVMVAIGALGAILGNILSSVVYFIHDKFVFIVVCLVAAIFLFIVMTGMHHAFTPIKLGVLASTGFEGFICIVEFASNMAQGVAALAIILFERFGSKVKYWITLNEQNIFTTLGGAYSYASSR